MAYENIYIYPGWDNQRFIEKNIILRKPYNKDTLEYLDFCFNQGLLQLIYREMKKEYKDVKVFENLFYFLYDAWKEKIEREKIKNDIN